jgi:hypothetical protein
MAITRPNLACLVLDTLASTGVPYAVLHGEDRIADGRAESDVDLAIGCPPHQVLRSLAPMLAVSGLVLGLVWPHDVGALTSVWLSCPGPDGVQLDLVCDPEGHGRSGVRTDALLERRIRGRYWWRLDGRTERLYLLAKRADTPEQPASVRLLDLDAADRRALVRLSGGVLADWRRSRIVQLLDGEADGSEPRSAAADCRPTARTWLLRARRRLGRVPRGVGCWVTVAGDRSGERKAALHAAFGRVLPRARLLEGLPPTVVLAAHLERRRAGLAISRPVPGVRPDLALRAGLPGTTGRVVSCLAERAEATLRLLERASGG